jgi:selenocysteine lyase/cysteine desulfurase
MPYVVNSGRAIVTPTHGHAERVPWSVLAEDVGVELRWDPPTQDGDYLHAAQREELKAVLAAWNAKHGQT